MAGRRENSKHDVTQAPIAVIGMSALFPQAPNLKAYWRLLRRGEDAVTEIPPAIGIRPTILRLTPRPRT